jgi:hypothetical protein
VLWDERRSSVEAHAILRAGGKKTITHRGIVDAVPAGALGGRAPGGALIKKNPGRRGGGPPPILFASGVSMGSLLAKCSLSETTQIPMWIPPEAPFLSRGEKGERRAQGEVSPWVTPLAFFRQTAHCSCPGKTFALCFGHLLKGSAASSPLTLPGQLSEEGKQLRSKRGACLS